MEENKQHKALDSLVKKHIKEIDKQQVSTNFTSMVMQSVTKEVAKKSSYKTGRLISKKSWILIFISITILSLIPFNKFGNTPSFLSKIDTSFLKNIHIPFDIFTLSETTLYAILLFFLMFVFQIIFLKKHFEKQFYS